MSLYEGPRDVRTLANLTSVYVNSLLATLSARKILRSVSQPTSINFNTPLAYLQAATSPSSGIRFASLGGPVVSLDLRAAQNPESTQNSGSDDMLAVKGDAEKEKQVATEA